MTFWGGVTLFFVTVALAGLLKLLCCLVNNLWGKPKKDEHATIFEDQDRL